MKRPKLAWLVGALIVLCCFPAFASGPDKSWIGVFGLKGNIKRLKSKAIKSLPSLIDGVENIYKDCWIKLNDKTDLNIIAFDQDTLRIEATYSGLLDHFLIDEDARQYTFNYHWPNARVLELVLESFKSGERGSDLKEYIKGFLLAGYPVLIFINSDNEESFSDEIYLQLKLLPDGGISDPDFVIIPAMEVVERIPVPSGG